ncbi:hypothetical protein [Salinicoccus sp. CNSTN-B1]
MMQLYRVSKSSRPVEKLKGVGPKLNGKLNELELTDSDTILFHLPSGYENLAVMNLNDAKHNDKVTVSGRVRTEPTISFFRRGKAA